MLLKCLHILKTYWIAVILGIAVVIMLSFIPGHKEDIAELEAAIERTKELIADSEKISSDLEKEFDADEFMEEMEQRTVSATQIGKEMVKVDDVLTAFYKTHESLPEDEDERDALFAELEEAQAKNTELTGAGEADHIKTWQLNPEWSLELESVITYQDTERFPVVFKMKTKDGKLAGLVHAIYNVSDHRLSSINRHYTIDGLRDEADVGGI
ncbi:hypothetical protein [Evansella clarkii]|uniref:hypothetical protein n=1 Tax=Evansella clarkii TaxID=79879 RepID=UPI0009966D4F|nr:hypothetical protein [Evansella clarkii]